MGVLYLVLFAIGIYAVMTLCRRWADSFIMIAFAIGCVVNANIFTAYTAPVVAGPIIFGIDSILMTMFLHLVAVKYMHYPLKEFKLFVASSIAAIIISAFIEFFATIFNSGWSIDCLTKLGGYFISCIATLLGIAAAVPFVKHMKRVRASAYLMFPISILIASIVNSAFYYLLSAAILRQTFENFWSVLAGSYIGKVFCILLGLLCYFISSIWGHQDAPNAYFDKTKEEVFDVEVARESDINDWMELVKKYRHYFPGLETEQAMLEHTNTVLRFMSEQRALCVRIELEMVGIILLSKTQNKIAFLLVDERYRKQGVGTALVNKALEQLDATKPITVETYIENDYRAKDAWNFYSKLGFKPTTTGEDDHYPYQVFELKK